jgi:hypothetical protein
MTHRRTAETHRWARRLTAPAVAASLACMLIAPGAAAAATAPPEDDPPARMLVKPEPRTPRAETEERRDTPAAVEEDAADAPSARLELPDGASIAPGDDLTAAVTIENPSADAFSAGSLALSIGASALGDRAALDEWLAGGSAPALSELSRTTTGTVDARGSLTAEETVESDEDGLDGLSAGVYPLQATFTSGGTTLHARSVVIVDDGTASVGIVVPLTGPPSERGLLTADQLAELTAPSGALGRRLDAVTGTGAVLAVDPALPAAIRALGASAPADAVEWLSRLESMPNERFALQFGDADVASQMRAGLDAPLQPGSLRAYERGEDFQLDPAEVTPTPEPTDAPEKDIASAPSYPELEELLDIGEQAATVYWPLDGTADAGIVESLSADGTLTLIPSTSTEEGADGEAVSARAEGALVYDAEVSDALNGLAAPAEEASEEAADPDADRLRVSAELWFASREADGRPLLLALDRLAPGAEEDEEGLRAALEVVSRNDTVTTVGLEPLLAEEPRPVTIAGTDPDEERVAAVSSFTAPEEAMERLATVLAEPEMLTGQARAEALQLLGTGWAQAPDAWRDAVAAHATATADRLEAVRVQLHAQVQLFSAEAPLPVWVHNNLAWPITVVLQVRPDDARLDVRDRIEVEVPAGSNPRVEIPVEARVGSGDVQLEVTLLTPTGEQIGPVQTMDVTVRAEWERIGLGVLIGIISLLVVGGIIRTVLRRRARKRAKAAQNGTEQDAEPGAGRDEQKTEQDEHDDQRAAHNGHDEQKKKVASDE